MADIIQVTPSARVKLQKNSGATLYDQIFAPAADTYTSHVGEAITIATNTSQTLNKGNIAAFRNLLIQADAACKVKLNSQATGTPLVGSNSVFAAFSCSAVTVIVVNESTTATCTIHYVGTN